MDQMKLFGMDKFDIDEMAAAAMKRLKEWINRSAGQHIRAMREKNK